MKLRFIGCLDEVASFKQIKLKWKIKADKNSMKSRNSREKGKFEFSEEKSGNSVNVVTSLFARCPIINPAIVHADTRYLSVR